MTDTIERPDPLDLAGWTTEIGRLQETVLEQGLAMLGAAQEAGVPTLPGLTDPQTVERAQGFWRENLALWSRYVDPERAPADESAPKDKDKRFQAPGWREPAFDVIRRSYLLLSDQLMRAVEGAPVDEKRKDQMRFAARGFIDAMSPANFPFTNPEVIEKTVETGGQNLATGLQNMLADMGKRQLTQVKADTFEVGRNLAVTPGQVVKRTPLYELIQYTPTTDAVLVAPLVIFPPWINRFYILDLTPEKSFIRWAVEQGITVFVVSWKSADASMKEVIWDDYVGAQIEAIDTVRELLDVPAVHAIGYCVAGTTLAATLALLAARGEADKVASATFFTAQVDFAKAGDLLHFVGDQLDHFQALSPEGYLDGRYLAHTFNLLRGKDLIWNYVTNNYLLGKEYAPFDLLHWNSDVTNLPAKWHGSYLADLYRDNLLVRPGALSIGGTPLDLGRVETPSYIQAGREDHIAPAESVWELTRHFKGPLKFVLAGSGHIAGVVNPPASGKYQYWTNPARVESLEEFVAGATETKGSWWPDWLGWLRERGADMVPVSGARRPGEGALAAIEPAPGSYVRAR